MDLRRTFAGVTAGLVMMTAACADEAADDDQAVGGTLTYYLAQVPASVKDQNDTEQVLLYLSDLERTAELAGVEPPDDLDDREAVAEYLLAITGQTTPDGSPARVMTWLPEASGHTMLGGEGAAREFVDEMGWSIFDASWFVEYAVPPGWFSVVGGPFDGDRLTEAIGEPEDGIWRIGEEDLGIEPGDMTVARRMGESLRLALNDDRLYVGRATPPVEDALDEDSESLADDPVLRTLTESLDNEDVYSALVTAGGSFRLGEQENRRPVPEEVLEELEDEVLPEPFTGFGAGLTLEEGDAVAVLAYTHDDETAAQANADGLQRITREGLSTRTRQPWSEQFTVDQIRVDGTTVVARLVLDPETRPQIIYDLVNVGETLVRHR